MAVSRTSYLLTAALVLVALIVASIAICGGANSECAQEECGPQGLELPRTTLRYSTQPAPETTIALFVDLSSHASRRLFTTLVQAIDQGDLDSAELLLFHAPADCDTRPPTYTCAAALAVECAEEQRPGAGLLLAAQILDDLWRSSPTPDLQNLNTILDSTDELGLHLDRDTLDTCANPGPSSPRSSPQIESLRIAEHHQWARKHGFQGAAGGFIIRREGPIERVTHFDESLTRVGLARLWRCTGIASTTTCEQTTGAKTRDKRP